VIAEPMIGAHHPTAKRSAYCNGYPGANNAGLTEAADLKVGEMHRATLAMVNAGLSTQYLCHQAAQIGALSNWMAVRAVVTNHVIVITQSHAGADDLTFLAN
jgi:hypothetical protein